MRANSGIRQSSQRKLLLLSPVNRDELNQLGDFRRVVLHHCYQWLQQSHLNVRGPFETALRFVRTVVIDDLVLRFRLDSRRK